MVQRLVHCIQVYPANTLRYGGPQVLQYKWQTAMVGAARTPLNPAFPNCLPYPIEGVRMLSGQFSAGSDASNPQKCTVRLQEDIFLSLQNVVGFYAFPADIAQGYPADSSSGQITGEGLAGACRDSSFLVIDGVNVGNIVDLALYFNTPFPGVWATPLSKAFLEASGDQYKNLTRRTKAQAKAFGGGNYVLFRFLTTGLHRITFGLRKACNADLRDKVHTLTWTKTDDRNIPNSTFTSDNLATIFGFDWFNRTVATWTMDITVTL